MPCAGAGADPTPDDLAIVIVSHNSAAWIAPCLRSVFAQIGSLRAEVIVVDAESSDATREIIATEFPEARLVHCRNLGFAHANNRALIGCQARYVLFLNPDTEILDGRLTELVRTLDGRLEVGLVGVRQLSAKNQLDTTIRHFPNALRALGDGLWPERFGRRPRWFGERELDPAVYERDVLCDWTSGSFMLARREAIESAGLLDERFFMYSEETDLCRRITAAGWEVRHLPTMTILHHGAEVVVDPGIESLSAYSRSLYARKHFSPAHRALFVGAVMLGHWLRAVYPGGGASGERRRAAARAAVDTLRGRSPLPYGPPSRFSVRPRTGSDAEAGTEPAYADMLAGP